MSVLMTAGVIVSGHVMTGHIAAGHVMTRMLMSCVRMQVRTGVCIAQDHSELPIDGRKHETRGYERAKHQHCKNKRHRPATLAAGPRPASCAFAAETHSFDSHLPTMPQRAVAIKLPYRAVPASTADSFPMAVQSRSAPPSAISREKRSRTKSPSGIGTPRASAAASTKRTSFCPREAAKPAGVNLRCTINEP